MRAMLTEWLKKREIKRNQLSKKQNNRIYYDAPFSDRYFIFSWCWTVPCIWNCFDYWLQFAYDIDVMKKVKTNKPFFISMINFVLLWQFLLFSYSSSFFALSLSFSIKSIARSFDVYSRARYCMSCSLLFTLFFVFCCSFCAFCSFMHRSSQSQTDKKKEEEQEKKVGKHRVDDRCWVSFGRHCVMFIIIIFFCRLSLLLTFLYQMLCACFELFFFVFSMSLFGLPSRK